MLPAKTEDDLWRAYVASLSIGLEMRKPDALAKFRLAVEKLDREISACALRREIRARAGVDLSDVESSLTMLEGRMSHLRAIAGHVRATLLDHDAGPSPESAAKAREVVNGDGEYTGEYTNGSPGTDDLNSELKRAASDIRSGWLVVVKRATCAVSGKQPGGDLDSGKPAKLAEQYYHFVRELQRKRMQAFAIDDVVCEGLSRADCAAKRYRRSDRPLTDSELRSAAQKVYELLVAGLQLYAEAYPPLSEGGE
jgi:hypothetical protein